jgi:hypothetical protein
MRLVPEKNATLQSRNSKCALLVASMMMVLVLMLLLLTPGSGINLAL